MNKKIISTRFTKEYKTDHPFVSAGMAFIGSTTSLALAVCRAGGIGSIGVGPLQPAAVRSLIQEMKKEPTGLSISTSLPYSRAGNIYRYVSMKSHL